MRRRTKASTSPLPPADNPLRGARHRQGAPPLVQLLLAATMLIGVHAPVSFASSTATPPTPTAAPAAPSAPATPPELVAGVTLLRGNFVRGSQPDGNTVVFRTPRGLVVVDSGRHAAHTQKIIDHASTLGLPIVTLVNTHWHLDHVGGNPKIRAAFPDVEVVASPAITDALTGFLANYRGYLESAIPKAESAEAAAPLRAELAILDAGPALSPTAPVTASGTRTFGGKSFELHLESHAVTAGDVWLRDPTSRVLVAGDLVTLPVPFLDTACPARWQTALDQLAKVDFSWLIPGHGPALTRADFERYRTAFGNLRACALTPRTNEQCSDAWLSDIAHLVPAEDHAFTRELLAYYLDQHLRADPAKAAKLCGT